MLLALPAAIVAGCSDSVNVDKLPTGTEVQVTRQDGGVVQGPLKKVDNQTVSVGTGRRERQVPRDQIAAVQVVDTSKPDLPLPAVARFREYTVPAGTALSVRLETPVATDTSRVEEAIESRLIGAVTIDGAAVLPQDTLLTGVVSAVQPAGKVRGRASLGLQFTSIRPPNVSERYPIDTRTSFIAPATKADDAKKIGIPAAGGAILGAILGGKKGAAIGGAIGGGAGTAVVLSTAGDEIRLARGAVLTLTLDRSLDVRVPIKPR